MNVACFPAIRTVEFSVDAHANPFKPLAIATIAVAGALPLRFVALHAQGCSFHRFLTAALTLRNGTHTNPDVKTLKKTIGQPRSSEQVAIVVVRNTSRRVLRLPFS